MHASIPDEYYIPIHNPMDWEEPYSDHSSDLLQKSSIGNWSAKGSANTDPSPEYQSETWSFYTSAGSDHSSIPVPLQPVTTNLSKAKPLLWRSSSDPNISRHKQPLFRPLEEQRIKQLFGSS